MVNKLFGKKIGMTRYFLDEGRSVAATVLKVGPCVVTQKKTVEKEGYNAIQVGFEPQKESRVNKPLKGHFDAAGTGYFKVLREIRVEDPEQFELGQEIKSDIFTIGETVHVSGTSKGRGFSGVMKRWGFSGGRKTHGSRSHRIPGSIGSSATPGRVYKGRKLPGHYGNQRVTVKNLKIIDVRPEMDVVVVKGAVPGSRNSLVEIRKA
ncbi:MAG: 50S ribosomal protein L3 [Deltaproteobacteria bacterium]|nr:50S ribosomal protein L3 [Deltaproteobacteria bacterium]MBW1930905.1 50S ribosomal protein L3 [Deltaproteobacteria bacterium]MBW2024864.1 50S ribosomal protein L3 [Deltaproteobacteria bacterium]MBW2125464.1 50S ribosomal protein L3 [Deltaproteobacteria bacterium]RLB22122.1 MAG: 50S ribosomal protein L3 [Deltaproteobacteria bacterium]